MVKEIIAKEPPLKKANAKNPKATKKKSHKGYKRRFTVNKADSEWDGDIEIVLEKIKALKLVIEKLKAVLLGTKGKTRVLEIAHKTAKSKIQGKAVAIRATSIKPAVRAAAKKVTSRSNKLVVNRSRGGGPKRK